MQPYKLRSSLGFTIELTFFPDLPYIDWPRNVYIRLLWDAEFMRPSAGKRCAPSRGQVARETCDYRGNSEEPEEGEEIPQKRHQDCSDHRYAYSAGICNCVLKGSFHSFHLISFQQLIRKCYDPACFTMSLYIPSYILTIISFNHHSFPFQPFFITVGE